MRRQRNTFQVREKDKTPEKELSETEMSNLPDREFKQRVLRMLTDLGRRIDELSENVNKEMEDIKKNQSEMKNTHSSLDGHLGCFQVLAIVNNAAMNTAVHVSLRVGVFTFFG